jgi:protein-tyrosine kinase
MSLIETALAKLRHVAGDAAAPPINLGRPVASAAVAPKAPVVITPPPRGYIRKKISVDAESLRRAGYLPQEGLERQFADHFRQIKRPLIDKAFSAGAEMRLIVVTSALPGDGKTFTSINLALSMARERDLSVLLVDADSPRGRISEVFGLRGERGLLDAIADETVDVESLVVQTDVHGLEILPAGKFVESAPELLASNRMTQIAVQLSTRGPRGVVLFDSAPLLVSSEARALLRVPGQVALVVRAGITPRQAAIDAATHIDKKKLQGLIINQAASAILGGYYGYAHYGEGEDQLPSGR